MALPPKTPPRFVPTLTEVVQAPGAPLLHGSMPASARTTVMSPPVPVGARPDGNTPRPAVPRPESSPLATSAVRAPAAMSPALTPSLRVPVPAPAPAAVHSTVKQVVAPALARPLPDGMEEYIVHRVMQRVDLVLDQRLREAIATVVQEQTRSVLPRLREEIESVVRHAVYEAVADELAIGAPLATKG